MAKKITQQIELDIITKGLENTKSAFEKIDKSSGKTYEQAQKVLEAMQTINNIAAAYGDNLPIDKAKELQKELEKIAKISDKLSDLEDITVFSDDELIKIGKIQGKIEELTKSLEKLQKGQEKRVQNSVNDRLEEIKKQKTVRGTDKQGKTKNFSMKTLQDDKGELVFKTQEDLIDVSKESTKRGEAAKAILQQLEIQATKTKAIVKKEIGAINETIAGLEDNLNNVRGTTYKISQEQSTAYETTSILASKQAENINAATIAAQEEGAAAVKVGKQVEQHNKSVAKAVKQLFSWAQAWNLTKKIIRVSIDTVSSMDESLTGMSMVTGKSREEVNNLIPRIQELSRVTSTAMTDIAGLITEYTKQGRSLEDSFTLAEETAKAAKIAGISAAEAIEYMTSAINGFNLAATDATKVSDIFANVAAVSATDFEDLAVGLSKVSAQANLAGMSIEYTTALIAKGIETTQEAPESIGTALKTILARMRELSDYGSTLEDGASVNGVESALAAAGIRLRTVNGEFRDMEDIFNELGPKWNSLNTMQQQAIAQAVAGTRQQSRFVAIMQDWERTQELAAEAQNSTGAAAAQYTQQVKGLDAAMTNLKTSWQSLIQSLVDSEFVIGIFKTLTTIIDGINNVLSAGGDFTKNLVSGLVIVLTTTTAIKKIHQVRVALEQSLVEKTRKQQELQEQSEGTTEDQLDVEEKITKEKNKQIEYELRALKLKKELVGLELEKSEVKSREDIAYGETNPKSAEESASVFQQVSVDEEYDKYYELLGLQEDINNAIRTRQELINQNGANVQLNYNLRQQEWMLEQEANRAAVEKIDTVMAETEGLITQLEVEKAITEEKIKQLEAEMNSPDTDESQKAKIQQTINKLTEKNKKTESQISKLKSKNAKLDQKRSKILTKENKQTNQIKNVMGTMVNKLGKKFGVDLGSISKTVKGIFGFGKDIKENMSQNNVSLSKLLTGEQARVDKYKDMLKNSENLNLSEEQKEELNNRIGRAQQNIANIQGAQKDLGTEGLVTQKQASKLLQTDKMVEEATLTIQEGQVTAETAKKGEVAATLPVEAAEAGANISESAAQPYGVGMPFAIAGAAILTALGLGAGIAAIVHSNNKSTAKNESITSGIKENTITIYNKQNDNKTIEDSLEVYSRLTAKKNRTEEEDEELENALSALRELDEDFQTLSDNDLVTAVVSLRASNEAFVNDLINENFNNALKIDGLNNNTVGLRAISTKLIDSQGDLIDANLTLVEKMDTALVSNIEKVNSEAITTLVNEYDYDSKLTAADKDIDWSNYLMNAGIGLVAGSLLGFPVLGIAKALQLTAAADVDNEIEQKEQGALVQSELELYNNLLTKSVVDMEKELIRSKTSLSSQLRVYKEMIEELGEENEYVITALRKQYSGLGFINDYISINTDESNQILSNIEKLVELGALTEDAIEQLASVMETINEEKVAAKNALQYFANDDGTFDATLIEFLEDMGVSNAANGTTSIQDMYNTVMSVVAKDDDGNFKKDNGYYVEHDGGGKWTNESFTKQAQRLEKLIALGYGDESFISILGKADSIFDVQKAFGELINGMAGSIDKNMTAEETTKALLEASRENRVEIDEYIEDQKELANKKYTEYLNETDPEKKSILYEEYVSAKTRAEEIESTLESTIKSILGDLDVTSISDKIQSLESTQEKINDLKSHVVSGELTYEDYEYLYNNVIPTLQDTIEGFDPSTFLQQIAAGEIAAIDMLDQYVENSVDENIKLFERNAVLKADYVIEAEKKLLEAIDSGEDYAIDTAQAALDLAKKDYALAGQMVEYVKSLGSGRTEAQVREFKKNLLDSRLEYLENEDNIFSTYAKQKEVLGQLKEINQASYDDELAQKAKILGITKEELQAYMDMRKGLDYDVDLIKWTEKLSGSTLENFEDTIEPLIEMSNNLEEINDKLEENSITRLEKEMEIQDTLLDAYKAQLEEEQEALQESLDKRKDLYDKYFDSLDEEDEDEDFETEQARLQNAIAKLSGATDATSLSKLKEYQEELADLESDQRQTERDRRRDAVSEMLDNQSEMLDQYYEDRLENEKVLWEHIMDLSDDAQMELLQKYTDGFENATDLTQTYMMKSFVETIRDMKAIKGESTTREDAYLKAWALWSQDPDNYDAPHYATGGLVDYTGYAWVDGTSSRPEAFLNADQTALFAGLGNVLSNIYSRGAYNNDSDSQSSVTIENFTIAVDATLTDNNVQQTGESLADALLEGLKRTGITVNMKR